MIEKQKISSTGYNRRTFEALKNEGLVGDTSTAEERQLPVPDNVKDRIKSLLAKSKDGLTPLELKSTFLQTFKCSINFKKYGFTDMNDFCVNGLTDQCFVIGHKTVSLKPAKSTTNTPLPIPDFIVEKIGWVLVSNPRGVQDSEFNTVLRRNCGFVLDPIEYNYLSMRSLLSHNKHVFYVDHNWRVYNPRKTKIDRSRVYDHSMSVMGALCVGKVYPVVWSVMCGPNFFWFLPSESLEELDQLTTDMNSYYGEQQAGLEIRAQYVDKENIVVVKAVVNYCRGRVLEIEEDKYYVLLLDSGDTQWFDRVYYIKSPFLRLPFVAVKSRIRAANRCVSYSTEEKDKFKICVREVAKKDSLAVRIVEAREDKVIIDLLDVADDLKDIGETIIKTF